MTGGKSNSESTSSTSNEQHDRRIAATEQAQVATEGSTVSTNIVIEAVDVEFATKALEQLVDFASGEGEGSRGLVSDALELVDKANVRALEAQGKVGELAGLKELLKTTTALAAVAGAAYILTR